MTTSETIEAAAIDSPVGPDNLPSRKHLLDLDDYSKAELLATLESAPEHGGGTAPRH